MKHKTITETNTIFVKEVKLIEGKAKDVVVKSKIVIDYIKEGDKNIVAHCNVFDTIL